MNSTLTSITNAAENDFLQDSLGFYWNVTGTISPLQAFIGLYNHNTCTDDCSLDELRSGWSWLDGESYNHTIYHNWRNELAHPQKGHQCARLHVSKPERGWTSDSCGLGYGFVCKQAQIPEETTLQPDTTAMSTKESSALTTELPQGQ